jgi:glutaredoxin
MRQLAILIAVIAVLALIESGLRSSLKPQVAAPARAASAAPNGAAPQAAAQKVVMYVAENCGYCEEAREYFADRGVAVRERDIGADQDAAQEFAALHGVGTPLILVGDERLDGFDEDALDDVLSRAGI